MYCYIFPLKMYGYILESRVVGERIAESRVVGEPIVACRNGFQFPSLYRQKRFSVSCKVGKERRKWFSVSVVVQMETVFSFRRIWQRTEERFSVSERSFKNIIAGASSQEILLRVIQKVCHRMQFSRKNNLFVKSSCIPRCKYK
jgi:hypothetical protein